MSLTLAIKSFRPNKTHVILAVALSIGGIAALSAKNYLIHEMETIESQHQSTMSEVIVAKKAVLAGELLTADNLAIRKVPSAYIPSTALDPEKFASIEGKLSAYELKSGDMIMQSSIANPKIPSFSTQLKSGRRAITVAVDEINSISGMLEPNDKIDLLVTIDQEGQKITQPVLQNVNILATGQQAHNARNSTHQDEVKSYDTITLDISPEEAELIISARETGKLTALLRNPSDKQTTSINYVPQKKMPSITASIPPMLEESIANTPKIARGIPVLYGNQAQNMNMENLQIANSNQKIK